MYTLLVRTVPQGTVPERRLWHLLFCQAECNVVSCKKCKLERHCSLVWLGYRTPAQNDALNTRCNKLHDCYTLCAFCQSIECRLHLFEMHILLLLLRRILSILFFFFFFPGVFICCVRLHMHCSWNMYTTLPLLSYGGAQVFKTFFFL